MWKADRDSRCTRSWVSVAFSCTRTSMTALVRYWPRPAYSSTSWSSAPRSSTTRRRGWEQVAWFPSCSERNSTWSGVSTRTFRGTKMKAPSVKRAWLRFPKTSLDSGVERVPRPAAASEAAARRSMRTPGGRAEVLLRWGAKCPFTKTMRVPRASGRMCSWISTSWTVPEVKLISRRAFRSVYFQSSSRVVGRSRLSRRASAAWRSASHAPGRGAARRSGSRVHSASAAITPSRPRPMGLRLHP